MGEILRDPVWQFVGVILAVIIPCVGYLIQRSRKKLAYEIVSRTRLVTKEEEIRGSLQIVFEGKPVEDVRLLEIKVINSGNVPIVSSDYERPVSLFFWRSSAHTNSYSVRDVSSEPSGNSRN